MKALLTLLFAGAVFVAMKQSFDRVVAHYQRVYSTEVDRLEGYKIPGWDPEWGDQPEFSSGHNIPTFEQTEPGPQ